MSRELPERPSPSTPIRDVLAQVLKQYGLGSDPRLRKAVAAWREAAGTEFFDQTQVVGVKEGVVTIQVATAPLLQELAVYHKRGLLAALKKADPSILDVQFRANGGAVGKVGRGGAKTRGVSAERGRVRDETGRRGPRHREHG